jgi:hypothetical protein
MIEDLKTDELNRGESIEPECQPEDSKPVQDRSPQRNGADEGLADEPLPVSPGAIAKSSYEEVDDRKELQGVETDIVKSTDACTEPTSPRSAPPFDRLLVGQLAMSVPGWQTDAELVDGAVQLYKSFKPVDASESVLARIAIGLTNATMDGLERAARIDATPASRQIELRLSQKAAATIVDVLTALDKHRGLDRQKVSVGSVNVGSGGRAVVGNVRSVAKSDQEKE